MNASADDFPRPDGVAEWIGTVIGVLLGVALAVIGAVAVLAVVSAVFGLVILPVVLLAGEPWWWAWAIGAGPALGMLLLAGVALTVGHFAERREEAKGEGRPFEDRGPAWRAAAWALDRRRALGHAVWAASLIALVIYAVLSWEIWPVVLVVAAAASFVRDRSRVIYVALLVAILGGAALAEDLWLAGIALVFLCMDMLGFLTGLQTRGTRESEAQDT